MERALGKKVIRENGPRLIDLDLLLYDELELETKDLVLPHPGILEEGFRTPPAHRFEPRPEPSSVGDKNLKSALGGLQERFVGDSPDDWNFK